MDNRFPALCVILCAAVLIGGCHHRQASTETPPTASPTASSQQSATTAPPATAAPPAAAIPILCFHDIGDSAKDSYSVTTKSFTAFVGHLRTAGYQTVSLAQVDAYIAGQGQLPAKPVVITFDDGWRSVLTVAKPCLDKAGYTATIFLIAQSIGAGAKRLSWDDVRALRKAGYEVGSHTLSHAYLTRRKPKETKDAFETRIRKEIADSKRLIDQNLGEKIAAIAYPYGLYDDFVLQTAQDEGYTVGCTIDRGPADSQSTPLRLPRQMVVNKTSLKALQSMLALKPLHLAGIKPTIGAHLPSRSALISFSVADKIGGSPVRVELAPGKIIKQETKAGVVSVSARLNPGAANVTVAGGGRITSWLIVCDGG